VSNSELDQVSGPEWVSDPTGPDRYDVVATMAPGTTKQQFREMLQRLLKERFELVVRHETRGVPGYSLLVAKGGPKISAVESVGVGSDSGESPRLKVARDGWPTLPPGPRFLRFGPGGGRERAMVADDVRICRPSRPDDREFNRQQPGGRFSTCFGQNGPRWQVHLQA
jgi:hypothetical protein